MAADALRMLNTAEIASPWRRLHWTLPLALLICAIVFIWFAWSMERPGTHTQEPTPIDAQLVELPAPAPAAAAAPPAPKSPPKPVIRHRPAPTLHHAQPKPQSAPPKPTAPAAQAKPATPAPPAPPTKTATPSQSHTALTASRGAHALYRPLPVIPDDLRRDAMNEAATARFHISADGSVAVELVKPTQFPRLNRLLLDTLRTWKFFPAMKDGKPVESTEEMVIRVQVK